MREPPGEKVRRAPVTFAGKRIVLPGGLKDVFKMLPVLEYTTK
jgi:hypothetical protein